MITFKRKKYLLERFTSCENPHQYLKHRTYSDFTIRNAKMNLAELKNEISKQEKDWVLNAGNAEHLSLQEVIIGPGIKIPIKLCGWGHIETRVTKKLKRMGFSVKQISHLRDMKYVIGDTYSEMLRKFNKEIMRQKKLN